MTNQIMNSKNILAEIANYLKNWKVSCAETNYCILSHRENKEAKIVLKLTGSKITCQPKLYYEDKYIFDLVGYSQMDYWEAKKTTASTSRSPEQIAKQFEKKLISEYLEIFKAWQEKIEDYLGKRRKRNDLCKYFARLIGDELLRLTSLKSEFLTLHLSQLLHRSGMLALTVL